MILSRMRLRMNWSNFPTRFCGGKSPPHFWAKVVKLFHHLQFCSRKFRPHPQNKSIKSFDHFRRFQGFEEHIALRAGFAQERYDRIMGWQDHFLFHSIILSFNNPVCICFCAFRGQSLLPAPATNSLFLAAKRHKRRKIEATKSFFTTKKRRARSWFLREPQRSEWWTYHPSGGLSQKIQIPIR